MSDRFRGRPRIDAARCADNCKLCREACPTGAIEIGDATLFRKDKPRDYDRTEERNRVASHISVDLGRCLFCTDCATACPHGAIRHENDFRLAARKREDLLTGDGPTPLAPGLDKPLLRLLGRSLRLRQVSAGGCNACEADTNVLGTVGWDIGRFGIQFVASPRHADGLLVTGPVPDHMKLALEKTYLAVPGPKIVIAAGACAISGGPYADHPEVHNGAASVVPVDLFIPGCPPHPLTILDGLLRLLCKVAEPVSGSSESHRA